MLGARISEDDGELPQEGDKHRCDKIIKNNKNLIKINQELLSWHFRQNKHRQNAQKEMCL